MIITGTNLDFSAVWDVDKQTYSIYKNGRFLLNVFCFRDVKNYIN